MTWKDIQEMIEKDKPQNKCKRCVWGRTIVDDKKNDIVNVMCMFPKCIKDKKEK